MSWASRLKQSANPPVQAQSQRDTKLNPAKDGIISSRPVRSEPRPDTKQRNGTRKSEFMAPVPSADLGMRLRTENWPSSTAPPIVRGLPNTHNSCFRNAVIQSLSSIKLFSNLFESMSTVSFSGNDRSILRRYCELLERLHTPPAKTDSQNTAVSSVTSSPARPTSSLSASPDKRMSTAAPKPSKSSRRRRRKKMQQFMSKGTTKPASVSTSNANIDSKSRTDVSPSKTSTKRVEVKVWEALGVNEASALGMFQEQFQRHCLGQQEDAQEFYHFLVDALHRDMLSVLNNTNSSNKQHNGVANDDGWSEVGKKSKTAIVRNEIRLKESPISRIFGGTMRLELKRKGMKNTLSTQPFFEIHLDIQQSEITDLKSALKQLATPLEVKGLRAKGREINASQHVSIAPSKALVLHLKRFNFDKTLHTSRGEKIDKFLPFPESLRLPSKLVLGPRSPEYRLRAVVVHNGASLSGGHYSAFVERGGRYFHVDDFQVRAASLQHVLAQKAYLLFYEREEDQGV
ncbi:hypothetical protein AAMO2058_000121900 [Amorphochlora amoebiformis]